MIYHTYMIKKFLLTAVLIGLALTSCSTRINEKDTSFSTQFYDILEEYVDLAKKQGIKFKKPLKVSFTDLNEKNTIGLCYSSNYFRKIEIDRKYWQSNTFMSRRTLIMHELTHCYCGRGHDNNAKTKYREDLISGIIGKSGWNYFMDNGIGYFRDRCPMSIMHPIVLSDYCSKKHFSHYEKEMFVGCIPW